MLSCATSSAGELDRDKLFHDELAWVYTISDKIARQMPPSFDPDDLRQEAAIEHWRRTLVYDPVKNNSYRGYAHVWIHGAVLMKCRRKYWVAAMGEEIDGDEIANTLGPLEAIEQEQERRRQERRNADRKRTIERRLKSFPPSAFFEEYVVRRSYLEGIEIGQIAATLGASRADVKRRLAAGVRILKRGAEPTATNRSKAVLHTPSRKRSLAAAV